MSYLLTARNRYSGTLDEPRDRIYSVHESHSSSNDYKTVSGSGSPSDLHIISPITLAGTTSRLVLLNIVKRILLGHQQRGVH